jgi:hypothetical protein
LLRICQAFSPAERRADIEAELAVDQRGRFQLGNSLEPTIDPRARHEGHLVHGDRGEQLRPANRPTTASAPSDCGGL